MNKKKIHVHFMGIGGSALAGVAVLAKSYGFKVSGCDVEKKTYYSPILKKARIKYFVGHNISHLKNVDLVAVSPALFSIKPPPEELIEARKRKILMSWQEFLGKYLQKGKIVMAVAGTHGKSTVVAMLGLVLEAAGLDPTVEVGAIVPQWQSTVRIGHSKYFVCEADEFNNNFLYYSPAMIVVNNLEMDHPEFFRDFEEFIASFVKFIKKIKQPKILIVNKKDEGVKKLLMKMNDWLIEKKVKVIDFYRGKLFNLELPGQHNKVNARGVIACAQQLKIDFFKIEKALKNFKGIGRRFELIGEEKGIKIFDDYAVHPTAVGATLKAAKERYPRQKIWAIFEPHQYSRLKLFLADFAKNLNLADKVIVTRIFPGRENLDPTIKAEDLVKKIGKKARYIEDFEEVAKEISQKAQKSDIIIVFGAGKSYLLSRKILEKLKNR